MGWVCRLGSAVEALVRGGGLEGEHPPGDGGFCTDFSLLYMSNNNNI